MSRFTLKVLFLLLFLLFFSGCRGSVDAPDNPGSSGDTAVATPASTTVPDSGFDCAAVSEIPAAECQALVAFYEATAGANWADNSGWLATDTPCSWPGVTCAGGHVDMLGIYFNNLQGQLPAALADLTQLRVLDLHNNALTGPIPAEYGRLTNLEYIDLSVNQLTGSIPETFGELAALQSLNLAHNELAGPLPAQVGQMAALRNLDLAYNQLNDELPASLASLTALETLRLRDNQFTGAIPFGLGELPALAEVDLTFNQLSGTVPSALYDAAIHRFWGNPLEGAISVGESGQQDVNYLGVAFTADTAVANSVWPELVPVRPAVPGPGVMWAPPEHIVFTLTQAGGPQDHAPMGLYLPAEAQIHIYPVAGLNAEVRPAVDALQQLLADPSNLAAYGVVSPEASAAQPGLSMLPPSNAVQNFRAQVEMITFAEGSGVRYLTQLSQGPVPLSNQELFYTFQGLTADGATYVAAYFPVTLPDLPDSPQMSDEAFGKLMEDWSGYLAQTLTLLDGQPTAAYTPDLAALDGLISSLSVSGITPTLEATWPNNGESVDAKPILQWAAFPGAVRYEVVVVDDDVYPPVVAFSQFTTDTMMPVEPGLEPGSYSWTVRALDDDEAVLAESNRVFRVKDAITLGYPPAEEAVDPSPILQWEPFAGAADYHIVVLNDGAYPPEVIVDQIVTEPMLAVDPPLAPGHYSWTVWAQDGDTAVLAELTSTFSVKNVVALVAPAAGETVAAEPLLAWQAFPGAVTYQVIVLDDDAYPPVVVLDEMTSETSFAITLPLGAGSYSWIVRAFDKNDALVAELTSSFVVAEE
ncbi:MAG: hypothetical protein IPM53_29220 [Anaerolineaceae bacterium]|nr:hypothetical protein [Anaerolineaceae bacterium]